MASAVSACGLAIRVPVTTTVSSTGGGKALAGGGGVVCASTMGAFAARVLAAAALEAGVLCRGCRRRACLLRVSGHSPRAE